MVGSSESQVNKWVKYGSYALIGFRIGILILAPLWTPHLSSREIGSLFGGAIFTAVIGLIVISIGNKCAEWAVKIKKSPTTAYIEGFLFSFLGLLVYYIYYRINLRKIKKS